VNPLRFSDATWQEHTDPRVAAIVAAVPYAADFDMASLAAPRVPVGLVTAPRDKWLIPQFPRRARAPSFVRDASG